MADTATIQTRITEVETAIHDLMIGNRTVSVSDGQGGQAQFAEVDLPRLREYLAWLQQQLAANAGHKRRPIYVEFGR